MQCSEIGTCLENNNSKKALQTIKNLTKGKVTKVSTIQNKDGRSLIVIKDIVARWTEYCSDLYNHQSQGYPRVDER